MRSKQLPSRGRLDTDHTDRLKRLRKLLTSRHIPAVMLTQPADIRYLCGFTGSNGVLLILPRRAVLLTDSRYSEQAQAQAAQSGVKISIARQLGVEAVKIAQASGVLQLSFDANHTTVDGLTRLQDALPADFARMQRRRFFAPLLSSPVAELREVKDASELQQMEKAAMLGCRIFDQILPHLKAGVSERAIAAELEYSARKLGAEGMSFDTIIASGPRSAMPHGVASAAVLPRKGFVTLDFGVILKGYCSDMTRTIYLGKPSRLERTTYEAVLHAQGAGVSAVRAGATAGSVDAACRDVLKDRGLAEAFSHSTGHGVGLQIHEEPRLGAGVETKLVSGMVVTVEPGVYLPGRFGIRIEDMVVVESHGARVLTPTPKQLLTL